MVGIRDSFGGPDARSVALFEERVGILPLDYRNFLIEHNGGRPRPSIFAIPGNGRSTVHFFLGFGRNNYDLFKKLETFQDRIPAGLIPIATDDGGNLVCLGVSGDLRGVVFFWDHERESEEGESPTWENVTRIADSFTQFISELT